MLKLPRAFTNRSSCFFPNKAIVESMTLKTTSQHTMEINCLAIGVTPCGLKAKAKMMASIVIEVRNEMSARRRYKLSVLSSCFFFLLILSFLEGSLYCVCINEKCLIQQFYFDVIVPMCWDSVRTPYSYIFVWLNIPKSEIFVSLCHID